MTVPASPTAAPNPTAAPSPAVAPSPLVAVCIVTYNSGSDLATCLQAVAAQQHRPLELVIVDCDSSDDSVEIARVFDSGDIDKHVVPLGENRGFAGGMNAAFARAKAPYLLTLNADVEMKPNYVSHLVSQVGRGEDRVGAVTGRLSRPTDPGQPRRLDACGMHLTRAWRHLDRGSDEVDRGQYVQAEKVFAGTGAATLWVRAALDDVALRDVAVDGEIFAEAFHSYREDAELGFRLQGRGWHTLYDPKAVADHRRSVGSGQRRGVSAAVNRSSLKNRYLLRIYHQSISNLLRTLPWTLWRDLQAWGWVLLFEQLSLGAYTWLWRHRRESWRRRQWIRRRVTHPQAVEKWFGQSSEPRSRGS